MGKDATINYIVVTSWSLAITNWSPLADAGALRIQHSLSHLSLLPYLVSNRGLVYLSGGDPDMSLHIECFIRMIIYLFTSAVQSINHRKYRLLNRLRYRRPWQVVDRS